MFIGIVAGVALAVASIALARRVRGESWLYSAALILLPFIYVAFALNAGDVRNAMLELSFGAPFIVAGAAFLVFRTPILRFALGLLWVMHAAFDILHDRLVVNDGAPAWYPLFCAAFDLVIGFYVIWSTASTPPQAPQAPSAAPAEEETGLDEPAMHRHHSLSL